MLLLVDFSQASVNVSVSFLFRSSRHTNDTQYTFEILLVVVCSVYTASSLDVNEHGCPAAAVVILMKANTRMIERYCHYFLSLSLTHSRLQLRFFSSVPVNC